MVIFDHADPKIIESTFNFPEFVSAWIKWLYSISSFLRPATRLATPIFDHAHLKNLWSAFNFCDHVLTCKKSVYIFHLFILQIQPILESHHQTGHTYFWPCSPQKFSISFNLCEIVPACKKSIVNFIVQRPDWPHPSLTMPHQNHFN